MSFRPEEALSHPGCSVASSVSCHQSSWHHYENAKRWSMDNHFWSLTFTDPKIKRIHAGKDFCNKLNCPVGISWGCEESPGLNPDMKNPMSSWCNWCDMIGYDRLLAWPICRKLASFTLLYRDSSIAYEIFWPTMLSCWPQVAQFSLQSRLVEVALTFGATKRTSAMSLAKLLLLEEILHRQWCIKPCKWLDKLQCRILAISSITLTNFICNLHSHDSNPNQRLIQL